MNLKKTALAFAFTLILATALPLHAQTGRNDSPENSTIVLALVAGAGVSAMAWARVKARRNSLQRLSEWIKCVWL